MKLMRLKITILIAFLLFVLGATPSCMKKFQPRKVIDVKLCSISSQLVDNSGVEPRIINDDSVSAKAFGFYLDQSFKEIPAMCINSSPFNLNVGNAVYASCDAKLRYAYNLIDTIQDVTISCSPQFSSLFPENSDMSDVFKVFSKHDFQDFKSLASTLYEFEAETKLVLTSSKLILLYATPDASDSYTFKIKFHHKSGTETIHYLKPVYLKL